ncbi:MAG: clostri-philic family protein [Clostridium sp.]
MAKEGTINPLQKGQRRQKIKQAQDNVGNKKNNQGKAQVGWD